LQAAAAAVVFQNGALSDTPLTELYAGSHDPTVASAAPGGTVGEYFADNPSTTAMAQLGGNQVWINAGLFSVFGEGWLAGTIMHELVHNITGLTDVDFQRALGIDEGASRNISIRLATDCFGWSAP
jgi:hypothetical protein